MTSQFETADFFNHLYATHARYWWRGDERYALKPECYRHSLITQMTLRLTEGMGAMRVLDLGAGEGADSIRLALLGHDVTAVDISKVGAEKISTFAAEAGVNIRVDIADICEYEPEGQYDLIICNGLLHYVEDKAVVIPRIQMATRTGGLNVVSLWSTYSEVPDCHDIVPVFCDDEDGTVADLYKPWSEELHYLERSKPEASHDDMPAHSHSHIKLIARKP